MVAPTGLVGLKQKTTQIRTGGPRSWIENIDKEQFETLKDDIYIVILLALNTVDCRVSIGYLMKHIKILQGL